VRQVVNELDLELADGRALHVYDRGDDGDGRLAVFWPHGTPNIGAPPEPVFPAADRLGLRWVSYDRPGYGGSSPDPGRDLASAAELVSTVADELGIDRLALVGGLRWSLPTPSPAARAAGRSRRWLRSVSGDSTGSPGWRGQVSSRRARPRPAAPRRRATKPWASNTTPEFTPADEAAL